MQKRAYQTREEARRSRMVHGQISPNFLDPALEWKRVFAELWGTFLLVLVAVGGLISMSLTGRIPETATAIAPGVMVMTIIYFMGAVSGAHLNPAVTFAFAIRRNFPWGRVPGYLLAQFAGGLLASAFLMALFGRQVLGSGISHPSAGIGEMQALLLETVLTAGLVNTILGTASGARNIGPNGAIAVGGYVAITGLWAGPLSGASMNPARSLAPAVLSGHLDMVWIYFAGPICGAIIGVGLEWILKGPPTTAGTIAAQGTLGLEEPMPDDAKEVSDR